MAPAGARALSPITASMLYDLVNCPHRVAMDLFADPAERAARRQLLSPVSDNYFCRRRVSKGVSPTTWRHSVIVVGRSVAVSDVSAEAPAGA